MHTAQGKERIEPRVRAMVRARLRDSCAERDICIIDMSTRGILATAARPPKRGEIIELSVGCNRLTGQVKWASERRFGVSLRERVSVAAMAEGGTSPAQLTRSVAVKKRGSGLFSALKANPHLFGKMGEYAAFGCVAVAGAYAISTLGGYGFAPLLDAFAGLKN